MPASRCVRLLFMTMMAGVALQPATAQIAIGFSVTVAPPPLPIYEQPPIPGAGYIWTPGYWAWGDGGYYWVPGTWVLPPAIGLLWTPGYWGWSDGVYAWNAGYWGPHIGFYGGVNYGCGYFGRGYDGGYWNKGSFYYNRSVNNISNVNITNVYNRTVVNNTTINRVSYNGGNGGVTAQPTRQEQAVARAPHVPPTAVQTQHINAARSDPSLRAAKNHGVPPVAATRVPGRFSGPGAVPARSPAAAAGSGPVPAVAHAPAGLPALRAPGNNPAQASGGPSAPLTQTHTLVGPPAARAQANGAVSLAPAGLSGATTVQNHSPFGPPALRPPGSNPVPPANYPGTPAAAFAPPRAGLPAAHPAAAIPPVPAHSIPNPAFAPTYGPGPAAMGSAPVHPAPQQFAQPWPAQAPPRPAYQPPAYHQPMPMPQPTLQRLMAAPTPYFGAAHPQFAPSMPPAPRPQPPFHPQMAAHPAAAPHPPPQPNRRS